jgi:hypothetical protein
LHSQVSIAGFFDSEFIVGCPESSDEVIGVRLRAVADAEIIDDETKGNVEGVMSEEAGGVRALVAVFREVRDQVVD